MEEEAAATDWTPIKSLICLKSCRYVENIASLQAINEGLLCQNACGTCVQGVNVSMGDAATVNKGNIGNAGGLVLTTRTSLKKSF